jgi:hypothetical protein
MNFLRLLLSATCVLLIGCKGDKQSSADDDKLREGAVELARNFILVDMPVELACRLRMKQFRLALASSPTDLNDNTWQERCFSL